MIIATNITFKSLNFDHITPLNPEYAQPTQKAQAVVVLGSSRTEGSALKYLDLCSQSVKSIVLSGKNIITGCGANGIMGTAYNTAREYSRKNTDGKPTQNLAIVVQPAYGDEDIENCIPIGKGVNESDRTDKFFATSDNFLIFPGRATTVKEATDLIQKNDYTKNQPLKNIVLIGEEFWGNLVEFYKKMNASGDLNHKPFELFSVADSNSEILKKLNIRA